MPRIAHPAFAVPGAMDSLVALGKTSKSVPGLPLALVELMHLRASQINGDGNNVNLHPRLARAAGETSEDRIISVASWRNTPWFSEPERAALALTEALTRLDDRADPVPDEVWNEARPLRRAGTRRDDPVARPRQPVESAPRRHWPGLRPGSMRGGGDADRHRRRFQLNASSTSLATRPDEAGFCPVTSRPSATANGWKSAPFS
ncbi:MAG: alkylhydroperoxidase [Devosia sp.]|jgi:AhpD family alkylhydroperoxidase|nr:alkylhydroperoxidase [Devosia sp.]